MRITIDTELQAIIVPNSYYAQIDKLNEVIEAAGGKSWITPSTSRIASRWPLETRLSVRATLAP